MNKVQLFSPGSQNRGGLGARERPGTANRG